MLKFYFYSILIFSFPIFALDFAQPLSKNVIQSLRKKIIIINTKEIDEGFHIADSREKYVPDNYNMDLIFEGKTISNGDYSNNSAITLVKKKTCEQLKTSCQNQTLNFKSDDKRYRHCISEALVPSRTNTIYTGFLKATLAFNFDSIPPYAYDFKEKIFNKLKARLERYLEEHQMSQKLIQKAKIESLHNNFKLNLMQFIQDLTKKIKDLKIKNMNNNKECQKKRNKNIQDLCHDIDKDNITLISELKNELKIFKSIVGYKKSMLDRIAFLGSKLERFNISTIGLSKLVLLDQKGHKLYQLSPSKWIHLKKINVKCMLGFSQPYKVDIKNCFCRLSKYFTETISLKAVDRSEILSISQIIKKISNLKDKLHQISNLTIKNNPHINENIDLYKRLIKVYQSQLSNANKAGSKK